MIKIAIANQSQHLIETLMRVLPYKIFWVAYNSEEVIQKAKKNPPDLILLDIDLPVSGAISITRQLVEEQKCSVLLTTTDIGLQSSAIFEALGQGASDVISLKKYHFDEDKELVNNLMRKIGIIENLLGKQTHKKKLDIIKPKNQTSILTDKKPMMVAIGASTGGPIALSKIISSFSSNSQFTVVIIQHIDQQFVPNLVIWLNDYSKLPVKIAEEGCCPQPGTIYLAAKNQHLIINRLGNFQYVQSHDNSSYAPSINAFFDSLAEHWKDPAIAILLTGMGNDGAKGLKKLHEKQWYTIVQNEESCVVFGMPKTAIHLGGVSQILSLEEIGQRIEALYERISWKRSY